jgi:hypothetical protein
MYIERKKSGRVEEVEARVGNNNSRMLGLALVIGEEEEEEKRRGRRGRRRSPEVEEKRSTWRSGKYGGTKAGTARCWFWSACRGKRAR